MSDVNSDNQNNSICQSCSLPLVHKDFFGTEKNGEKNYEYCCLCYRRGFFTEPEIDMNTLIKYTAHIYSVMKDMSYQRAASIVGMKVPRLKRWAISSGFAKKTAQEEKDKNPFYIIWKEITVMSSELSVSLIGRGDFLYARRVNSTVAELDRKMKGLDVNNITNYIYEDTLAYMEGINVLFNLAMDKKLILEADYYKISEKIEELKAIFKSYYNRN